MTTEALEPTEVLPPPTPTADLTHAQVQAATLEAAGASRKEIAHAVGVSESAVKQWRDKDAYRAEIARLRESSAEILAEPLQKLHEAMIEGAREGIQALVTAATTAEEKGGRPAWQTRIRAAEKLAELGVEVRRDLRPGGGEAAGTQSGVVQLQVNIGDAPG